MRPFSRRRADTLAALGDHATVQACPAVELHAAVEPAASLEGYRRVLLSPMCALATIQLPSITPAAPTCHAVLPSRHCWKSGAPSGPSDRQVRKSYALAVLGATCATSIQPWDLGVRPCVTLPHFMARPPRVRRESDTRSACEPSLQRRPEMRRCARRDRSFGRSVVNSTRMPSSTPQAWVSSG